MTILGSCQLLAKNVLVV